MTQSPSAGGWEASVERQIRAVIERGDFDNLPGSGEPIAGLDRRTTSSGGSGRRCATKDSRSSQPRWCLRREVADARDRIAAAATEEEIHRLVAAINRRIADVNAHATDGPSSDVVPLAIERVLSDWQRARRGSG